MWRIYGVLHKNVEREYIDCQGILLYPELHFFSLCYARMLVHGDLPPHAILHFNSDTFLHL